MTVNMTVNMTGDRLSPSLAISSGVKRKFSPTSSESNGVDEIVTTTETKRNQGLQPFDYQQQPQSTEAATMVRRDSLPLGLRNKKMKPTDCLLFAATLLEQDAAAAIVEAAATATTSNVSKDCINNNDATALTPDCGEDDITNHDERTRNHLDVEDSQETTNEPKDADVLCGRGGKVNKHPGNIVYRKVVDYNKSYYQSVHKKHRILVSKSIVQAILNYGGRFMGQKGKEWTPIGFKRAVQKTSQALRERSNITDGLQVVGGE